MQKMVIFAGVFRNLANLAGIGTAIESTEIKQNNENDY
ncbi:MAG: hypothetical protein ACI9JN_000405 [Bacteroidia bacterium]|jgi:hypothetical protein